MSNSSCVCLPRLVVRTSGFHPDNMGSIPVGDAKGAVQKETGSPNYFKFTREFKSAKI